MITPDLLKGIDERLAAFLASVHSRQGAILAARGRYFQGLVTPTVTPADGDERPTDATRKPSGQVDSWAGAGIALPANSPASVEIHSYNSPRGRGYAVILRVLVAARLWRRVEQFGPETGRNRAWEDVDALKEGSDIANG